MLCGFSLGVKSNGDLDRDLDPGGGNMSSDGTVDDGTLGVDPGVDLLRKRSVSGPSNGFGMSTSGQNGPPRCGMSGVLMRSILTASTSASRN